MCNVTLGNLVLANIVNGYPIELQPFDFIFQRDKIISRWIAVEFLPMTQNATNDPKVRWETCEGGAPTEATQ